MAPDPQNASSPPARRTLADLPPELKGIIARMAREQDSAFQQRMKGLELQCDTVRLGKSDWHGRSAHALFLVDRAWNMAVTPMLFETIDSNRCKEKIFGFQIARKHARFVKRVHFCQEAREEEEDWESLLRATPSFVNLEHVTFAYEASNALFNAEGHPDDDQAAYREALQSVAPSVRSLRIEEPCPGVVRWMLPMFVNLRRFEWTIFFEDSDQPGCLALKAMARCSTLEHLTLLGETEELFEEYVEEEETKARSWPSLRSLTVGVSTHLGIEGWRFIRSFRETLERVTVDLHRAGISDALVKESGIPPSAFPHLQQLTIKAKGPEMNISPSLRSSPPHPSAISTSSCSTTRLTASFRRLRPSSLPLSSKRSFDSSRSTSKA